MKVKNLWNRSLENKNSFVSALLQEGTFYISQRFDLFANSTFDLLIRGTKKNNKVPSQDKKEVFQFKEFYF
jgi:hypothetical protein